MSECKAKTGNSFFFFMFIEFPSFRHFLPNLNITLISFKVCQLHRRSCLKICHPSYRKCMCGMGFGYYCWRKPQTRCSKGRSMSPIPDDSVWMRMLVSETRRYRPKMIEKALNRRRTKVSCRKEATRKEWVGKLTLVILGNISQMIFPNFFLFPDESVLFKMNSRRQRIELVLQKKGHVCLFIKSFRRTLKSKHLMQQTISCWKHFSHPLQKKIEE